jgi:di/tricarboxylate transporter
VRAGALTDYITELTLPESSALAGKPLAEALGPRSADVRVLQVIRGEEVLAAHPRRLLAVGDALIVRGGADALVALHRADGVAGLPGAPDWVARGRSTTLAELLVRPASGALGARVRDLELHARHGAAVLAIQREGAHLRTKVADLRIRLGDVLLIEGDAAALASFRGSTDFLLLEGVNEKVVHRHRALPAVLILVAVVAIAATELLPISLLALAGTLAMVASGCLTSREAYRAIDLRLLVLMAGTIGLGRALESSGGAVFLAEHIVRLSRPFGDVGLLSAVYLVCNLLTALISNAAAALIMLPIAVATAMHAGLEPRAFVIAVLFAASIDFSTPIGYQTNAFVYGPGGYRFSDYLKVGGPLNLLWWILATALIPVFWPLRAA